MSQCPACGQAASGKFCNHCGAALTNPSCRGCGSSVGPGDRFCHKCGLAVGGSTETRQMLPWLVAGAAVVILVLVVIVRFTGSQSPANVANPQAGAPTTGGGMVDLSQMTPREAADRLFDRIMMAHEQGNTEQVNFFLPMAIQSYQMLGQKDADAHYHLGLIHTVAGEADGALAQADSIALGAPNHLFASMLRATASQIKGDSVALRDAYRSFLTSYDGEIATGKPEYGAHQNAIEAFRDEADASVRG